MPDNKLKDNEIKKALEYWKKFDEEIDQMLGGRFKDDKMLLEQKEIVKITLNLFDLINHLQAKVIKEQNKNSKLRNERNRLQAENERLERKIKAKEWNVVHPFDFYEQIKAEAYKEMADILTANFIHLFRLEESQIKYLKFFVDKTLKELVGDNE